MLYRAFLALLPRGFRARHGREMERVYREGRAAADAAGAGLRFRLGAFWDLGKTAAAEHARALGLGTRTGGGGMAGWLEDAGWALGSLRRSKGFALMTMGILALGIGATTAIFSVVQGVLLRPLPYDRPDELAIVWGRLTTRNVERFPVSPPDFLDVREASPAFAEVGAVVTFQQSLVSADADAVQVPVAGTSANFLELLGVRPLLGRGFTEADAAPNDPTLQPGQPGFLNAAGLLSHSLWQQRFGGDPSVVGRIVEVGGGPMEIVGVLPEGLRLHLPRGSNAVSEPALWTAMQLDYAAAPRNNVFLQVVARLRPGASVAQAQADADRLAEDLRGRFESKAATGYEFAVRSLHDELVAPVRPVILALMGAVGLVLLIACANVSNLLLVRGSRREREVAVRAAVGGGRFRIFRQMALESLVLALGGAAAGTALAWAGIRTLVSLRPDHLPRIDEVGLDPGILAFAVAVALASSVVFGLVPALRNSRAQLATALKDRGRTAESRSARRLRNVVVVAEVALSTVLLVGAGLMMRSFDELRSVEPGYRPDGVLTFSVPVPFARYPDPAARARLLDDLQGRLSAIPGVEQAAAVFPLPLGEAAFNGRWGTADAEADPSLFRQADFAMVLPGYFEAAGTRLEEGRGFSPADQADSAAVVVIDRVLADQAFPGGGAVGGRILARVVDPENASWFDVVGVVEPQRHTSLVDEGRGTVFFTDRLVGSFASAWVVRTSGGDPTAVAAAARRAVSEIDPDLPMADTRPFQAVVDDAMADTRFALVLLTAFGGLALVLAGFGLYGVLAYVVRQRRAEIGVRLAFGAAAAGIVALVLRQGMGLAVVGVATGLLAGALLTGLLESLLVGVPAGDPLTFGAAAGAFLVVAALACLLPAVRASHVNPVDALREE